MKVNSVSINFQSKQRFVSPKTNAGIKQVLLNMQEESIIINKDKVHMLKSLAVDEGNVLSDNRTSISQPIQLALFDVGNKAQLVIDTETGKIIDYYKKFFTSWKSIQKAVSQSIDKILENFQNEKVVKRTYLTVTNG